MNSKESVRNLILFFICLLALAACEPGFNGGIQQAEVNPAQAEAALEYALGTLGSDYVWGGNGPETFDCSGLIVWSYQQAIEADEVFYDGTATVNDVTVQVIYNYNVRHIEASEITPGDIIFITDREDAVTHGGLIEGISETSVSFINASSYYGFVVRDTWELEEEVRGQWIVGFGRLLYAR